MPIGWRSAYEQRRAERRTVHDFDVEDEDLGYNQLIKALADMDVSVYVGLLQDRGSELSGDGSVTLAGYAAINEFGSDDGMVPERSFLRSTLVENEQRYVFELLDAARDVVIDGADVKTAFGLVGLGAENDVKDKIRDLRDPPNTPYTLAQKYPGDNPLIDSGKMRNSIGHAVTMGLVALKADEP